jgi:hypothetical protein
MLTSKPNAQPGSYDNLLKGIFLLLAGIYLVNCLTPLRLCVDTIRYFGIKDCIEFGCDPNSDAAKDYMPYGYTMLLILLSKLGILRSFSIVLINCIYLFTGILLVTKMFGLLANKWTVLILILLNWTIIKFVTHPLSEMQYLFFSVGSLFYFNRFQESRKAKPLILSLVAGILAFLTRSVGVALFASLVAGLAWIYRKEIIGILKKNKILVAIVLLLIVGVVVFSKLLGLDHYSGVMSNQFQKGLSRIDIIGWHFTEWGEVSMNTSIVKVIPYFPFHSGKAIFIIIGLLIFLLFFYILFFRKNNVPDIVRIYLLFYAILMFNWPFYDPRFWVPVLPLIVAVAVEAASAMKNKGLRIVWSLFLVVYSVLGIGAVGYLTYTSLHKENFARTQANGVYRNEYETRFYGKPQSDTARKIDPLAMGILNRYN